MRRPYSRSKAVIIGIAIVLTGLTATVAHADPQNSGADYEPPSWMKARLEEERGQAAWRAQVRAASVQNAPASSKVPKARRKAVDISPAAGPAPGAPDFAEPSIVLPRTGDPAVEALRLQAAEDAADRARLRKAAAALRASHGGKHGQAERDRLRAAQQSRRDDEARLEAAQQSRRDDEARLEAAQQSRREDQSRLEAAQQSRREDEARLEAAQAERRRQH